MSYAFKQKIRGKLQNSYQLLEILRIVLKTKKIISSKKYISFEIN